jgi:transcriptional regulator with XRE-family HTH domain
MVLPVRETEGDPASFVDWLRKAMGAQQLTVRELGRRAKVSASGLAANLRGETQPTYETIHKLATYFGVDPNYLLGLLAKAGYNAGTIPSSTLIDTAGGILLVPVLDMEASAGGGAYVGDWEYVSPTIATQKDKIVVVRVRGDCMEPLIADGDEVIVERGAEWGNGKVVLARMDDRLLLKRAYRTNSHVRLTADNPAYGDIDAPDAAILGVVIRVIKRI